MVAAADPLLKTHTVKQATQVVERNVRIRGSAQDLKQKFTVSAHYRKPALDHGRDDLTDAALQLAIVSDG